MNKPYKIVMSRGDDIRIDADEIPMVLEAIRSRQPALVRSGIFNPAFYISVVKDEDRWSRFLEDTKYKEDAERRARGPELLANIFEGVELKLPAGPEVKQLHG